MTATSPEQNEVLVLEAFDTPSWHIVAKNDRTVHPEQQRFVAARMNATTTEVDTSHVPMLSNQSHVVDVIRGAAYTVAKSKVS